MNRRNATIGLWVVFLFTAFQFFFWPIVPKSIHWIEKNWPSESNRVWNSIKHPVELAQAPLTTGSGIDWYAGLPSAATIPDYTNNMWVDTETDTILSAGVSGAFPAQGAVMTEWTNIAAGNPSIGTPANSFQQTNGSATWPYWTNNTTPLGKGAWQFSLNANQNWRPLITGNGQPQPYTIVLLVNFSNNTATTQVAFDGATGARTLVGLNNSGLGGAGFFSGAGLNGVTVAMTNRWDIWAIRNDGGTTVDMKTNNVDYIANGSGTAGSAGSTLINLANDNTFVQPFKGQMAAVRFYHEIVSPANLSIIWTNLYKRYIGATPPR